MSNKLTNYEIEDIDVAEAQMEQKLIEKGKIVITPEMKAIKTIQEKIVKQDFVAQKDNNGQIPDEIKKVWADAIENPIQELTFEEMCINFFDDLSSEGYKKQIEYLRDSKFLETEKHYDSGAIKTADLIGMYVGAFIDTVNASRVANFYGSNANREIARLTGMLKVAAQDAERFVLGMKTITDPDEKVKAAEIVVNGVKAKIEFVNEKYRAMFKTFNKVHKELNDLKNRTFLQKLADLFKFN